MVVVCGGWWLLLVVVVRTHLERAIGRRSKACVETAMRGVFFGQVQAFDRISALCISLLVNSQCAHTSFIEDVRGPTD